MRGVASMAPTRGHSQRRRWSRFVISCQHSRVPRQPPSPAPDATAAEPAVHALYLRLLLVLLGRRGVDVEAMLTEAGIASEALEASESAISLPALQALVSAALARSGSPWLGLELGASVQAFSHGPVGYAAIASGSLRQALEVAVRFIALRAPVLGLSLQVGASHTRLDVHEHADLGVARRFVLEAMLVMLEHLLQAIAGRSLQGLSHQLPWPEPTWSRHYAAYLGGEVGFAARRMSVRFPNSLLDSPCLSADPQAFELARQECERRLQQGAAERDLASRIRRQLWRCEGEFPSAEATARRLGLSPRSLYRSLAAAGCSYRGLLDEARCERASRLLRETTTPVQVIAERLGYADASNFSRCFKRWRGLTPSAYRAAAGSG